MDTIHSEFVAVWNQVQRDVHLAEHGKGWHDEPREDGTLIALMHAELSEALEAIRCGNVQDEHIPEFSRVEVEMADVILRIMDFAALRKLRIAEAVVAKALVNRKRDIRHGGKQF